MGRPIGSVNKEKPFADALRIALRSGNPHRLRAIAEKLIEKAEQGDLHAIREVADRMDGKAVQGIERADVPVQMLSDAELLRIAAGGLPEPVDDPDRPSGLPH
ncbi:MULTISPECIES: hypothetical protein [unclassified Bradyrhizobium]|uniref:hypothetical protein n=1 Tax=unclassified Bradyrhizobium TaxID=2631580 RepID=UPI002FF3E33A